MLLRCVCYIRGARTLQPHRLQTAMSLYSEKLSALVLLVDGRINSLGEYKKGIHAAVAKTIRIYLCIKLTHCLMFYDCVWGISTFSETTGTLAR